MNHRVGDYKPTPRAAADYEEIFVEYEAFCRIHSGRRSDANEIMRKMTDVSSVLNRVVSKLGLDKRLREHTFLSLWPTFVPSSIADRSRPLFIDAERNLVISVADAATGQELSMMRSRVLAKVSAAARSLGIEISGIRPDLKHYHSNSTCVVHPLSSEERLPAPTEAELAAITLNESEHEEISKLAEELTAGGGSADTNARMVKLYEHKYPTCAECGNPVERLHKKETRGLPTAVCIACLYAYNI
jgi:hypothetical protein